MQRHPSIASVSGLSHHVAAVSTDAHSEIVYSLDDLADGETIAELLDAVRSFAQFHSGVGVSGQVGRGS